MVADESPAHPPVYPRAQPRGRSSARSSARSVRPPTLVVQSDRRLFAGVDAMVMALEQALAGGADALQVGDWDLPGHDLLALTLRLREVACVHGARLIVGDRADVALALRADALHLLPSSLSPPVVRRLMARLPGPGLLIGRAVSGVEEAVLAQLEEADYLVFSPVWPQPGFEVLRAAVAAVHRPVLAGSATAAGGGDEGTIPVERVEALREAGVVGLVLCREVLAEADPAAAAARYVAALHRSD